MNYAMVLYILGYICNAEALLMLLPLGVGLLYGESVGDTFGLTIVLLFAVGAVLTRKRPKKQTFYAKEGFVTVSLCWIVMSLFGALPLSLSGEVGSYVDCFFEIVSGFTTTGASVVANVEILSQNILFWRSFTHWIGGMGVLVFVLMVLPMAGQSSIHLMRAESPGPIVGKFVPKLRSTAILLYGIYMLLTVILIILLMLGGMSLFDSLIFSFGTAGTGGFANYAASVGYFGSAYIDWVITIFMILFGVNFNVYYMLFFGHFLQGLKNEEMRWYLGIIAVSTAIVTLNISHLYDSPLTALRYAAFQVSTIITTTGYATTDFALWPVLSHVVLLLLMIAGACAGSTGGGIKTSRIIISVKSAWQELRHLIHPRTVTRVRLDGRPVEEETRSTVGSFLTLYALIVAFSVLLLSVEGYDFNTTLSAVLACFNNVGPGIGLVGPMGNYGFFTPFSKLLLSFDMLLGRLEIFPMLVLFSPSVWRKSR